MSLLVLENLDPSRQRKLFTLLGVAFRATPLFWVHYVLTLAAGLVLGLAFAPGDTAARLLSGVGYGLLIELAYMLHEIGHILAARACGAPMTANVITATAMINTYTDVQEQPSRVHIIRTLGGPLMNLVVFACALAINASAASHFLNVFAVANLILAGAIAPIPSLDGAVIVRELRSWKAG